MHIYLKCYLCGSQKFFLKVMSKLSRDLIALVCICFSISSSLSAQVTIIKGRIQDAQTDEAIPGVEIRQLNSSVFSDPEGNFSLRVSGSNMNLVLTISKDGYQAVDKEVSIGNANTQSVGTIRLEPKEDIDQIAAEDLIPTVSLSTNDLESEGASSISGILTASRDVFISTAAFVFGPARFRIRGYDSEDTQLMLNGIPMNDLDNGRVIWSVWGGLNDVLRNRSNMVGLGATPYAYGGIGGASSIDTRASRQRKQVRASYAVSNRTYRNRVMATYSTGLLKNGWAFTLSGSRRWAEEGYIDGTPYDAYSYFLSVDKKINDNNIINLTVFGAPNKRGRSAASTQELYDLSGNNYYNPNWGYQNGEKRNARIATSNQPMAILRHDLKISERTNLTTAVSFQDGRYGTTAIEWGDGDDPRPDYYRRLPSFVDNDQFDAVLQQFQNNPDLLQLDWNAMYAANQSPRNFQTVINAGGIEGNTVTGQRAKYIIEERRFDSQTANFYTNIESILNDNVTIAGGLSYQWQVNHTFKTVDDLLGADYFLDVNKFRVSGQVDTQEQNNLDNPNRAVTEGDVFGFNYEIHNRNLGAWVQSEFRFRKFDFFLAANASQKRFWRNGLYRNGRAPENSQGKSEEASFFDYGGKLGATYKIDGRNYLIANASFQMRAPFSRNAFITPRTQNLLVGNLEQEQITSIEAGYLLKAPYAKIRAMGYYTTFKNRTYNRVLFLDDNERFSLNQANGDNAFFSFIMRGLDIQHAGLELAGEIDVSGLLPGLKFNAVAALGQYIYTSRPTDAELYSEFSTSNLLEGNFQTIFMKNFNVPGTPQTAYSIGINYNSPDYWFLNLNLNYFDNVWIDVYPLRRSLEAISLVAGEPQFPGQAIEPDSDLWNDILDQEKAPSAFTLDLFGGKSWRIRTQSSSFFIYLNVGVSNILDNQDFITGGYEQFRFDFEGKDVDLFPNRYFYSFGRTYFVNLSFRI